jgi:hypothetical protein
LFRLGDLIEIGVWFIRIIEVFVSSMVSPLFQDQFKMRAEERRIFFFNYALIP